MTPWIYYVWKKGRGNWHKLYVRNVKSVGNLCYFIFKMLRIDNNNKFNYIAYSILYFILREGHGLYIICTLVRNGTVPNKGTVRSHAQSMIPCKLTFAMSWQNTLYLLDEAISLLKCKLVRTSKKKKIHLIKIHLIRTLNNLILLFVTLLSFKFISSFTLILQPIS